MRLLYFDCFSGISGDMILGAFLDAGVDKQLLLSELAKLPIDGYKINVRRGTKAGISGTDVEVVLENHNEHNHEHRSLSHIETIIDSSTLDEEVKSTAKGIFRRLAQAEAQVHGCSIDEIHFHEVGAVDAIVDIVGAAISLYALKPYRVCASPLNVGSGFVRCQHGILPVPAPAVVELLKNVPIYSFGADGELTTPTGAAILSYICHEFGPMPSMTIERVGYGLGKRDYDIPDALRLIIGQTSSLQRDEISVLECNVDDMSPEILGYSMERLFDAGALDVFYTPVMMKKSRPAAQITVLCQKDKEEVLANVLFKETSTLGVRKYQTERWILPRKWINVPTQWGNIRVKVTPYEDGIKYAPEYDDCAAAARKADVPIRDIYQAALAQVIKEA